MHLVLPLLPPPGNGATVTVHDNTGATYADMGGGALTGMCAGALWHTARRNWAGGGLRGRPWGEPAWCY